MEIIVQIFYILGSLAVFLYGMKVMSDGIQKIAGEKLHTILNFMTKNRVAAVFTGFFITCIIQSSSATTVMVVSFVNAGLLTLVQSIGVILGANIGTTFTGWIVSIFGFKFSITTIALPCIGIAIPFIFSKKSKNRDIGEVIVGFGLLFLGLQNLKESVPDIKNNPEVLSFLTQFTDKGFLSILVFILAGTIVTVIIQSSSAAMAITITMAFKGWITFPIAAAFILGENIGTTITAYLASINTNVNARRAARAHLLFNLFGVLWMIAVFPLFLKYIVDPIIPGDPSVPEMIPIHLSMFHTLFNITNTFIFIWFIPIFAKIVKKLVRPGPRDQENTYKLDYFTTGIQDTAEINILKAKSEIYKMASITKEMFEIFLKVFNNPDKKLRDLVILVKEKEDLTDQMQEEISRYLAECAKENLNEKSAGNVTALLRITHELESVADSCYNLMVLAQRRYDKKMRLNKISQEEINEFSKQVKSFIEFYNEHLNQHLNTYDFVRAVTLEKAIDESRNKLKKNAQKRLQKGANVRTELLFIDVIRHFERIGDYSLNISEALRQIK